MSCLCRMNEPKTIITSARRETKNLCALSADNEASKPYPQTKHQMNLFGFVILAALVGGQLGCTAIKLQDTQEWLGRSVRDLELHPEFSKMYLRIAFQRNGTEVRTYVDSIDVLQCSFPTVSHASGRAAVILQGSSCSPAPPCNHRFTLDTGKIVAYEIHGSCAEKDSLRPR